MDERTGNDGRAGRNGVETAGGPGWRTPISEALRAHPRHAAEASPERSSDQSAQRPRPSPAPAPASAAPAAVGSSGGGTRPAPGLDDPTPPGGVPLTEPPLWREAVRFAPTSPAPYRWDEPPPAPGAVGRRDDAPASAAPAPAATSPSPAPAPASPPPPAGATAPAAAGASTRATAPTTAPAPPSGESPEPAAAASDGGTPPAGGTRGRGGELPQRVPAEPDVPDLGEPPPVAPPAEAPELARIATRLRHGDVPRRAPGDGFDVDEVLAAVRAVPGVRAATLRASHTGAHTLRLDLAGDADPVQVSRVVARMLQERMGLSAAPQYIPPARPASQDSGAGTPAGPDAGDRGSPEAGPSDAATAETTAPQPRGAAEPADGAAAAEVRPPSQDHPPLPPPGNRYGPRVVIDNVQVNVVGTHATVRVQLAAGGRRAIGLASGPAIDSYVVRLAAVSAAKAIDQLIDGTSRSDRPSRCFVEHTGVVPFGRTEVAVVVVMLVCGGWVEQLAGSAVVDGDARHAAVRATLGAVNRRLDALLAG